MSEFISIPVPVDRVQDVYRLLGGVEDVRPAWEDVFEKPVEEAPQRSRKHRIKGQAPEPVPERKAPQCRATRTIQGERKRCQKGARHQGRHQWKEEE